MKAVVSSQRSPGFNISRLIFAPSLKCVRCHCRCDSRLTGHESHNVCSICKIDMTLLQCPSAGTQSDWDKRRCVYDARRGGSSPELLVWGS